MNLKNFELHKTKEGKFSPFGLFKVRIEEYAPIVKNHWNFTQCVIINIKTNEEIRVIRNYPNFYHNWIIYKGKEYLLCSQNYHGGMTCIDASNNKIYDYKPEDTEKYIPYFCWSGPWVLSPDEKTLAVCGCYWGAPYEWKFYDVNESLILLPLKELFVFDINGKEIHVGDYSIENITHNMDVETEYDKKYGYSWLDNDKLYNEYESRLKAEEREPIWGISNTFSNTGIYRDKDKLIYNKAVESFWI